MGGNAQDEPISEQAAGRERKKKNASERRKMKQSKTLESQE
jgi:hypothetical protein